MTSRPRTREAVEQVVRERVEHLLSSGEAPSLEWDELRNLPYDGVGCRDPATVAAEQKAMKPSRLTRLWYRF